MHLPAISSATGMIELVRVDEALKFSETMGAALDDVGGKQLVRQALQQLITVTKHTASGLVCDPLHSQAIVAGESGVPGLAFRLHQLHGHEVDPLALPQLIQDWGVEAIKNNYGLAFLEVYYHPTETEALRKKQLIAELADYCQHEGIDFMLSVVVYTPANEEFTEQRFQEAQLQAIQELRQFPQLLALQYPHNPLAAATITAELDIPWVISDLTGDYEVYKQILRDSLESGAKGFLVGEALWKDITKEKDAAALLNPEAIDRYFTTTARDRILELVRITEEYQEK